MTNLPLKRITRLRAKIVEIVARVCGVPTKIDKHAFPEFKEACVHLYLEDCLEIGEKVFKMGADELVEMYNHFHEFHMEHIDNEWNLHDDPFRRVSTWRGIMLGNDPRLPEYEERYRVMREANELNLVSEVN